MGFESPALVTPGRREASCLIEQPRRVEAIGAPLEVARLTLLDLVGRLSGLLGEHAAPLLAAARQQLEQRACRIAVIGQIKAGKSTFINALAERPGLLPTDINPWTVVVTALHFRSAATPPEHAAVFHLFSVDEWKELADGGGRLRELTERLVPGFQSDLLRAQLEVMRKRAERRLGPRFAELLGKCHRFATVTPEVLEDYVSAGDETSRPCAVGKRRHYSDITRAADLYFNEGPFAFPITLIDTPGTNDPFLVRDEITRRSLENPDIYVFVVSALQLLSAGDVAMLRLLNGLYKDRIVVFINRIDQLPDPASDAAAVRATIEKRLSAEFPTLQIPVVCGSARLASLRLEADRADCAGRLPVRASAVRNARLQALIERAPDNRLLADCSRDERPRAPTKHASSGMREVSAAITGLMCTSGIAMLLRQIAVCLAELVRTAEVTDRAELESIDALLGARRQETVDRRRRLEEEQGSLAAFEEHADRLQASFRDVEAHFKELLATATEALRDRLGAVVREFAEREAGALREALQERPRQSVWRCDIMPLRHELEAVYLGACEVAASDLDRIGQFVYPQLKLIVASLLPDYRGSLLEAPAWPQGVMPPVTALGDKVTMDLGLSWWSRWFAGRKAAEERAGHLRCLIEQDFLKIADELVEEAELHLRERVDYVMRRVDAIGSGLRTGIERRAANLAKERELIDSPAEGHDRERFEAEQKERAETCVQRQEVCSAALGELVAVLETLDIAQGERP
jgi:signal recognition particle receptor subunit beta